MVGFINKKVLSLYCLLFLYIYNIGFVIFPGSFKTRLIIGLSGTFYYLHKHNFNSKIQNIIYFYLVFLFFAIITSLYNLNFDFWFIQYILLNLFYLFGGIYIMEVSLNKCKFDINQLLYAILIVIIIHNLISLAGVFIPPLQNFIVAIQKLSNDELIEAMMEGHGRSIGIGDGNFFHGGAISGIGLIIIVYLRSINYIKSIKALIYFIVLLISGIFIARTTLIGGVSFFLYFLLNHKEKKRCLHFLAQIVCWGSLALGFIIFFAKDVINIGWAFEIFISFMEKGSIETASTNDLQTMFIYPTNLKTFLIGDGLFHNSNGLYYMHTDIGHLRLLFYWGITGVLLFWIFQLYISKIVQSYSQKNKNISSLLIILFIYTFTLNIKGFIDVNFLLFLLLGYYTSKIKINENRICNQ